MGVSAVIRPEAAAWLRLTRVHHQVTQGAAAHLRQFGLSVAQFDVLAQVGARPGRCQITLSRVLLTTAGNLCQLLDRMEERDLVRRAGEGRNNRLFLTAEGEALYRVVVPAHEAWLAQRLGVLSATERRGLQAALRRLQHWSPEDAERPHSQQNQG